MMIDSALGKFDGVKYHIKSKLKIKLEGPTFTRQTNFSGHRITITTSLE